MKFTPEQDQIIARMWGKFKTVEIAAAVRREGPAGIKAVRQRGRLQLGLGVGKPTGGDQLPGRKLIEVDEEKTRRIVQLRRSGATWDMVSEATGLSSETARRAMNASARIEPDRGVGTLTVHRPRLARPAWFDEPGVLAKLVSR